MISKKRELIEKAVVELKGEWPKTGGQHDNLIRSTKENTCWGEGEYQGYQCATAASVAWQYICTRAEFDHVVGDCKDLHHWQVLRSGTNLHYFQTWIKGIQAVPSAVKSAEECQFNWRTPLPSEQDKPQKPSNWHERGELPPVGEEVEYTYRFGNLNKWSKGKLLYLGTDLFVVSDGHQERAHFVENVRFRPAQTERDKLIDEAVEVISDYHSGNKEEAVKICFALYNANLLSKP